MLSIFSCTCWPFVCVFFGKLPISFSLLKKSNLFCCWVVCILPIFCTLKGKWMSLSHVQHFINPKLLLNTWFVNIFSDPEGCHCFFIYFAVQKLFSLMSSQLISLCVCVWACVRTFSVLSRKSLPRLSSQMFSSNFMVSGL